MRHLPHLPHLASLSSPTTRRVVCAVLLVTLASGALLWLRVPAAFAYSTNGIPVIYVHGYNSNSAIPGGCNGGTNFGTIKTFLLNSGWTGPEYSVKFYNGDQNCDADLHALENYHCTGWYAGNNGTKNEDIRHLSCLLAWYIWDAFTSRGVAVKLIGHSMGGEIIRQALFDTPYIGAFPPYLTVEDVVTAGTPHQGLTSGAAFFFCGSCSQVAQMEQGNSVMQGLNSSSIRGGFGRNPQGDTGTDWTTMASGNDEVLAWCAPVFDTFGGYIVSQRNPIDCGFLPRGTHLVNFKSPNYSHGGYLTDNSTTWNASEDYSDNNGGIWHSPNQSFPHSIQDMTYAIAYSSW